MYKVKETFEYLVEDVKAFTTVSDILDICNSLPECVWKDTCNPLPIQFEDYSTPWGDSTLKIEDFPTNVTIHKDDLVELLRKADKLDTLEAWGVDNWEGYNEAMQDLDDSTDTELLIPYLND